ncbi:MAG: hypothetical protein ACRENP_02415 [Longimicrobiales bacterium]
MSHLSIETLARLVEETADSHEAEHLENCDDCRAELEGMKADAAALAALPGIDPPVTQWQAIEKRLIAEGLLRTPGRQWNRQRFMPLLQLAAAIAIFVLGHYTAPLLTNRTASNMGAANTTEQSGTTLTSGQPTTNSEQAFAAVRETERAYLNALTRYAELAGRTETTDPLARLAALESIVLTTRAALGQAPADPVINGYHLTALAQRDATIKRLTSNNTGQTWF